MFDRERYLALRNRDFLSKLATMQTHVQLAGGECGELFTRSMTYGGITITDWYLPVYNPDTNDGETAPVDELHIWQITESGNAHTAPT